MPASTGTNEIIFIGLNPSAIDEARSIRRQGNSVIFIGQGQAADSIKRHRKTYNLMNPSEVEAFIKTLGLSSLQNTKLTAAINTTQSDMKDELANLVDIFARMEKTRTGPGRLVLSGHSIGRTFWGDHNGTVEIKKIEEIAAALPVAASLIEDLHLSACYSGNERYLVRWRRVFPNVSTIWAYSGSAPGTYSGAQKHLSIWNSATKGNKIKLDRAIASNTRKGKNVAVWSRHFGYQAKGSSAINDLINRISAADPTYLAYFSGDAVVLDTQSGPLREYYNDLQELIGHELATPSQITTYRKRLEKTIRLIYFKKTIRVKFASQHATQLSNAYKSIGIPQPDYAKLSRKACLDEIGKFEQAARNNPSSQVVEMKELLIQGLKNLEKTHIPANWI
jgi:hypothetical protein